MKRISALAHKGSPTVNFKYFALILALFSIHSSGALAAPRLSQIDKVSETLFEYGMRTPEGQAIAFRLLGRSFSFKSAKSDLALLDKLLSSPTNRVLGKEVHFRLHEALNESVVLERVHGMSMTDALDKAIGDRLLIVGERSSNRIEFVNGPRVELETYSALRKRLLSGK